MNKSQVGVDTCCQDAEDGGGERDRHTDRLYSVDVKWVFLCAELLYEGCSESNAPHFFLIPE